MDGSKAVIKCLCDLALAWRRLASQVQASPAPPAAFCQSPLSIAISLSPSLARVIALFATHFALSLF
eukprot:scaffold2705_cov109-Isochrysis_galbana.AAC.8